MLFVFDGLDIRPFWMKNTLIPLDMIWLDQNFSVIDIQTAEPCEKDPCKVYMPAWLAQYVLEINWGTTEKIGLVKGETMTIGK